MKVIVLGGSGVFGSRLADLLCRDGHQVFIGGRRPEPLRAVADRLGCTPVRIDRDGDLSPIAGCGAEVLVDAAGPFHAYGADPYRLARYCARNALNYIDLSDDAEFTRGIASLDAEFRKNDRFALSGASSVPAISAAAARHLARNMDEIVLVESAILPGNRAPRGHSVIASILSQVGSPVAMWRGGQWRKYRSWTAPRRYALTEKDRRTAFLLRVPDTDLFPEFLRARSVLFRAGMELGTLNFAVSLVAAMRRLTGKAPSDRFARLARHAAGLLISLGSDRGGMIVETTGNESGETICRRWRLLAEAGDGPYMPAVPTRALLRRPASIAPGAHPCLEDLELGELETATSDLAVETVHDIEHRPSLFRHALGEDWSALSPTVRRMHSVQDVESFSGTAEVTRGSGLLARLAAAFFGFPAPGENVPLTITKTRTGKGEIWERDFNGKRFRSYLKPSRPGHYRERFWAFDYEQELPVADGRLSLPVRRGWFAGIPLPGALLPGSDSTEYEVDGEFRFDVGLYAPLNGGLIVRYRGTVKPDATF